VTLAVVDLSEPVDVDEGKRKGRAGSMRPLSSRDISSRPNLRAQPPVSSSAAANFNASTPSAILARLGTVACCLLAVIDSPSTVIGSVRTVGRRPPPVTQRPRKDIFQRRRLVDRADSPARHGLRAAIANHRRPITALPRL
jgi:hypothetical protein